MRKVTIIVPIYKDWSSLEICIESLKECIDKIHKVILINDMSNEWEELENNITRAIKGKDNFEYYKNESNMGFIKTCNRGMFELDNSGNDILLLNSDTKVTKGFLEEMLRILYQTEKHGVVCPRSNNATLLTVPVKNNLGSLLEPEESYRVYCEIRDMLPEKQIIPTGVGFAMLIKRKLIDMFGGLDEIYGLGYNEENDFCMRVNQYGYNVVMANRAFVYHYESKSFGDKRNELESKNSVKLVERYPYYPYITNRYFNRDIDCVDYFSDLLADGIYDKKRILISLYELPSAYNGTAEYGLSICNSFYEKYNEKYDISILTNKLADDFFKISEQYPKVYHPDNIQGTYHLVFSPSQIFNIEHLFLLNRVSLKYVFCMQDIISVRSNYIAINYDERKDIFKKSIRYCSAMTSISEFSLEDTREYYANEFKRRNIPTKVIYHGTGLKGDISFDKKYELAYENYFMIFGNYHKHKFIKEIMDVLKKSKHNFIIIGSKEEGKISDNIYGYKSGMLSDDFINYVIANSRGMLFPSVYEGFGLPILNAIDFEKKIVVNNNQLNRELKGFFDNFSENILMFDTIDEIEGLLDIIDNIPEVKYKTGSKNIRTWSDVAIELENFIAEVLAAPVDINVLRERYEEMKYLENVHRCYVNGNVICKLEGGFTFKLKRILQSKFPSIYWKIRKIKGNV